MTVIRRGLLSELFIGVVAKKLSLVETITPKSNQHEFQGIKPLRRLFGLEDRRQIQTKFIWLSSEQEAITEDGFVSWSNVRKGKPRSAEYHLYYSSNSVTSAMEAGDTLFIALRPDGAAIVIIAPSDSTIQSQLLWLFGLTEQGLLDFEFRDIASDFDAKLDFAARYILDELGIDFEEAESDILDTLIEPFGLKFPTTRIFSDCARASVKDISARSDPDGAFLAWVEREEMLFRRLERRIVTERLQQGFASDQEVDLDSFMSFSLSVQNRRKARVGSSLENHLEALFLIHGLKFQRGAVTENKNRPDFLFPSEVAYKDISFPVEKLTMLGSKSTLKDRWRQVLSEANRINEKHLFTLEPGISVNQTDEMNAKKLQLVLPRKIHSTFKPEQRSWLMDLEQFIELVKFRSLC